MYPLMLELSMCFCSISSEAGLLNKSSCLAPALGVTKFIFAKDIVLITLCGAP
jgi:hypothetical protein